MVEFGYASKYNPVGWKATIPDTPDVVDAIGCVGDSLVYFVYDIESGEYVCKIGSVKTPSQVWAAMPNGGSYSAHAPTYCFNILNSCALRLRYVSGSTYYLWLEQSGDAAFVIEAVLPPTIGSADPYAGYTARLYTAATTGPTTYTYLGRHLNDAGNPTNTSYAVTIPATGRNIAVATGNTNGITYAADESYSPAGWAISTFNGLLASGYTKFLTALTNYRFTGLVKWPSDSGLYDGGGHEVQFVVALNVTPVGNVTWSTPLQYSNINTEWRTYSCRGFKLTSAEIRAYRGAEYVVVKDLSIMTRSGRGDTVYLPITTDTVSYGSAQFSNRIKNTNTNFFGRYGVAAWYNNDYLAEYGDIQISGCDTLSTATYTWNASTSHWDLQPGTTYQQGYVAAYMDFAGEKYGTLAVDFKDMAVIECQASTVSNYSDLATYMPAGFYYFPHYGAGVYDGYKLHLYKDCDPTNYIGYPIVLNSEVMWGYPQYVKYVDPESGDTRHRYSLKLQASILNLTFDETFSNLIKIVTKPFKIVYSDGSQDSMSRAWTAFADITGKGMFSKELVTAGATILDVY